MEVVYECCGGLDVHAKTVVACLVTKGGKEIRTFATMTDEVLQLGDWLSSVGCTPVAIESANIKLGQVASEVLGLSGRLMLRALAEGEQDVTRLAELAQGKVKDKKAELRRALAGRLTQVQRWVLAEFLTRVEELEAALTRVEARMGEEVAACPDPFVPVVYLERADKSEQPVRSRPGVVNQEIAP